MRYVIYEEGKQVAECDVWPEAVVTARSHAPATIQDRRMGTTPGSRRRTWIVLPEDVKVDPTYMGGQDPVGD